MYFFEIRTKANVKYEGLSSNIEDLRYLLRRKIQAQELEGEVVLRNGKKVIERYAIEKDGVMKPLEI